MNCHCKKYFIKNNVFEDVRKGYQFHESDTIFHTYATKIQIKVTFKKEKKSFNKCICFQKFKFVENKV